MPRWRVADSAKPRGIISGAVSPGAPGVISRSARSTIIMLIAVNPTEPRASA